MFCPCSQSFSSKDGKCPSCGLYVGIQEPRPRTTLAAAVSASDSKEFHRMHAGVRRAVNLMLIAVAGLPVFKLLIWLYPENDKLIPGTRSVDLFEQGGVAILLLLFGGGILRAVYALTVERKRDAEMLSE